MNTLERFLRIIDKINTFTGRIVAHFLLLLMVFMTYEVVMRYVFSRPSLWAMELNQYIAVFLIALGGGYTLLNGRHINADLLYSRISERTRTIFDLVTAPLFFLFIVVLLFQSFNEAAESWKLKEYSDMAGIPIYPARIAIVVGAFLLLLQGFAKFLRDIAKIVAKTTTKSAQKS